MRVKAVIGQALIMRFTGRPRGPGTNDRLIRHRQNGDLLKRINLICPVQSCLQKYSSSRLTQIKSISPSIPSHTEGRIAIVTDVGRGMRWTRAARVDEPC
jgi:hypothetical protein